jgi:hypothetical protein
VIVRRFKLALTWARSADVRWGAVAPVDVVIFETANIDYLLPLCGAAKVARVEVTSKALQVSWALVVQFFGLVSRGIPLKAAYYAALIRQFAPKIVITYIDNSEVFHDVARADHGCRRYLAIQNAARYDLLELSPEEARRIFIPEFACFGGYERDVYTTRGACVDRFYPLGSLREAYFRRYRAKSEQASGGDRFDYDLCVVAESSPGWNLRYPGFEEAIGRIAQFAIRLAREKGLRLVIAGKRDAVPQEKRAAIHSRDAETLWYEKYIGTEVPITPRVREQFTTYQLTSRSRLSLAMVSTVLREAASRGGRVLFCNFSGNPLWDFCVDGIWSLKEHTYEAFAERVMAILALTDEAYAAQAAEMTTYVINNDDRNPTYAFLENLIADAVAGKA